MQLRESIIDEQSLLNKEHPRFIRVFRTGENGEGPSDGEETLGTYERMGLLQACVDKLLDHVSESVASDLEKSFISQPSIHLEDSVRRFLESEGFQGGEHMLSPHELGIVANEIITQVEAQGIAGFDSMFEDITGTTMHFLRA